MPNLNLDFKISSPAAQTWFRRAIIAITGLNFLFCVSLLISSRNKTKVGYVDNMKITKLFLKELVKKHSTLAKEKSKEKSEPYAALLAKYEKITAGVVNAAMDNDSSVRDRDIVDVMKRYQKMKRYRSAQEAFSELLKMSDQVAKKKLKSKEYAKITEIKSIMARIEKQMEQDIQKEFNETRVKILEAIEKVRKNKSMDMVVYSPIYTSLINAPEELIQMVSLDSKSKLDLTEEVRKELGLPEEKEEEKKKEEKKG